MIFNRFSSRATITIFYHLYAINQWEPLLLSHLNEMTKSGLYSYCKSVFVGVNYENEYDLKRFQTFVCGKYRKIKILFIRKIGSKSNCKDFKLPYESKKGKHFYSNIEIGESETILAMLNFCRKNETDHIFFLHSKGVTCPGLRPGQIEPYKKIAQSIDISLAEIELNRFADAITHELILRYISNWRLAIKCSQKHNYHYLMWNIFIADSKFISRFKWRRWFSEETTKRYTNQKFRSLTDRHAFAGFPIKLDSQTNKRSINAISKYFNYPIPMNLSSTNSETAIRKYRKEIFEKPIRAQSEPLTIK